MISYGILRNPMISYGIPGFPKESQDFLGNHKLSHDFLGAPRDSYDFLKYRAYIAGTMLETSWYSKVVKQILKRFEYLKKALAK